MSTMGAVVVALALTAATVLGEAKQWLNDVGQVEHAQAEAYDYVDRQGSIALEVRLEQLEQDEDGKTVVQLTLMNNGAEVLLYNPGFGERTPPAGIVAVFDADGRYRSQLNWPPVGYLTRTTDWVKLERGQGFVKTWRGEFSPGTRVQVIYWRWLLEPRPADGEATPTFREVGLSGRAEIMRSNVLEIERRARAAEPEQRAGPGTAPAIEETIR